MYGLYGGLGSAFASAYLESRRRAAQEGPGPQSYHYLQSGQALGQMGTVLTYRVPRCAYCGMKHYEKGRCTSCGAPEGR